MGQAAHVNFRNVQAGGEALFHQQHPVFRDEVVSDEYQVGGGFPLASVGIDIGAHQAGGLAGDQSTAVVRLACHLVTGGQV